MKKILFVDRDGTLIHEPDDLMINTYEKLSFLPGVIKFLKKIVDEFDFIPVIITNQDGLGTSEYPEETFWPPHNKMLEIFRNEGVEFDEVFIDKTFAKDNQSTRKPGTALLTKYINGAYDLSNSIVVGDRYTDIQLAKNLGGKGILIGRSIDTEDDDKLDLSQLSDNLIAKVKDWEEIYSLLKKIDESPREAIVSRKTNETNIQISINLDGTGASNISTGLGFFDHMLEQVAKHAECDLKINVEGDLHIDEHHTIEDTALALGEAFKQALGSKKGIERYGFLLPMDEALAQVAIDFSGRPFLVWEAQFDREKVGDMPTELFKHFFKSFTDTSLSTLNIKVVGDNEHHKIEAIFKAFAKAIKMAVKRTGNSIPSTKGTL